MMAESPALPGNDGSGLDDHQAIPPAWPETSDPRPEDSVGRRESLTLRRRSPIDGELVPECQDLELQRGAGAEAGRKERKESEEDSSKSITSSA